MNQLVSMNQSVRTTEHRFMVNNKHFQTFRKPHTVKLTIPVTLLRNNIRQGMTKQKNIAMSLQRVTHQIVEIPITCAVTTANRTLTQRFRPVVAVELKKKGNEKQFGWKKKVPAKNRHKNGYVHRQEKTNLIIKTPRLSESVALNTSLQSKTH